MNANRLRQIIADIAHGWLDGWTQLEAGSFSYAAADEMLRMERKYFEDAFAKAEERATKAEFDLACSRGDNDANHKALVSAAADRDRLAAENAKTWIPVSEKLPAAGQRVIAAPSPSGSVVFAPTCCTFQRGLWCNDNWHRDVELDGMTHWMPMPEPPTTNPSPIHHKLVDGQEADHEI